MLPKQEVEITRLKEGVTCKIDPATGKKVYYDKNGKKISEKEAFETVKMKVEIKPGDEGAT